MTNHDADWRRRGGVVYSILIRLSLACVDSSYTSLKLTQMRKYSFSYMQTGLNMRVVIGYDVK